MTDGGYTTVRTSKLRALEHLAEATEWALRDGLTREDVRYVRYMLDSLRAEARTHEARGWEDAKSSRVYKGGALP